MAQSERVRFRLTDSASLGFDLIRYGSAQAVVIGHSLSQFDILPWARPPHFMTIQNVAVVVFFFLSGLLISMSVAGKIDRYGAGYNFGYYLFERATRILSGLVPALVFVALIDAIQIWVAPQTYTYYQNYNISTFVGNLFSLQDYPIWHPHGINLQITPLIVSSFGSGRPLWSLAIEVAIYVVIGYSMLSKTGYQRWWGGGLFLLYLPIVFLNYIGGRGDCLAIIWLMGFAGMIALRAGYLDHGWKVLLAVFVVLAIWAGSQLNDLAEASRGYNFRSSVMVCFVVFAFIVFCQSIKAKFIETLTVRIMRFLAAYSYTLFLTHNSILYFTFHVFGGNGSVGVALIAIIVSNLIAATIAYFTEMRLDIIRDFFARALAIKEPVSRSVVT